MKPSPTFPIYWKEWLTDATFLSLEARGAHATLMLLCWQHEHIPSSLAALAPACGTDLATMERVWPSIARFYEPAGEPGGSTMGCPGVEESRIGQAKFRSAQAAKSALGVAARTANRTPGLSPGSDSGQPLVNPDSTLAVAVAVAASDAPTTPTPPPAEGLPIRRKRRISDYTPKHTETPELLEHFDVSLPGICSSCKTPRRTEAQLRATDRLVDSVGADAVGTLIDFFKASYRPDDDFDWREHITSLVYVERKWSKLDGVRRRQLVHANGNGHRGIGL